MSFTRIVTCLFILWTAPSYAQGDPWLKVDVLKFEDQGKTYNLIVIESDPQRRQQAPLTGRHRYNQAYANQLLLQTQDFLTHTHKSLGKKRDGTPINHVVLDSYEKLPDPKGRLEWSDAGAAAHRVDHYWENPSLILIVTKDNDLSMDGIVGTAKFVKTSRAREITPLVEELGDAIPLPLLGDGTTTPTEEKKEISIKYENLARNMQTHSPVQLLLKFATRHRFFDEAIETGTTSRTYLNCEDKDFLIDFHEAYGFTEQDEDIFNSLPALRLWTTTSNFVNTTINNRAEISNSPNREAGLNLPTQPMLLPVDWQSSAAKASSDIARQMNSSSLLPKLRNKCEKTLNPQKITFY